MERKDDILTTCKVINIDINMRASQRYFQAAEDFRWRSLLFERIVKNIECFLP